MKRELSAAGLVGWKKFWDGWLICPDCAAKLLAQRSADEWPVPADYCRPIEQGARCTKCGTTPEALAAINARTVA